MIIVFRSEYVWRQSSSQLSVQWKHPTRSLCPLSSQNNRCVQQQSDTQQNNTYTLTHCSEWHTPELCHMFIFVSFSMETDFCHINIILVCVHAEWCSPVQTALLPPLSWRRTSKWLCVKSQRVINVAPLDGHMTTAVVSDCKHVCNCRNVCGHVRLALACKSIVHLTSHQRYHDASKELMLSTAN